jgi:hypothetical protein
MLLCTESTHSQICGISESLIHILVNFVALIFYLCTGFACHTECPVVIWFCDV